MSYTSVFGGNVVQPSPLPYIKLELTANAALSWPTEFQTANDSVAAIMDVDLNGAYTLTLPDATLASVGQSFMINNLTGVTHTVTINDFDGGLVTTIPYTVGAYTYTTVFFYLNDNTDSGGTYTVVPYGGGNPGLTSIGIDSGSASFTSNISITDSPLTANGAITLDFEETGDLNGLVSFGASEGIPYRSYAGYPVWNLRSINGTIGQISSTVNATDITLALDDEISGLTAIGVGNFSINGSTLFNNCISSTYAGDISIYPSDAYGVTIQSSSSANIPYLKIMNSGYLYLGATNGVNRTGLSGGSTTVNIDYIFPTAAPTEIGKVLSVSAGAGTSWSLGWADAIVYVGGASTAGTLARYVNTTGGLQFSTIALSDAGDFSNVYSLSITQGATNGLIIGYNDDVNTIASASGEITLTPNGVSEVVSSNSLGIRSGNSLRLYQPNDTFFSSISCPYLTGGINHDINYILPSEAPSNNSLLYCSNYNTALDPYQATLTWSAITISDTQITGSTANSLTIAAANTGLFLGTNTLDTTINGSDTYFYATNMYFVNTNAPEFSSGIKLNSGGSARFQNAGGTNVVSVNATGATVTYTLNLPVGAPAEGDYLRCTVAGQLYWSAL